MAQGPLFSWCEHMNVTHYRADVHKHNSSPVCVYLTVSTVDVAVVLPVEGAVDRAVFFLSDHKLLRRVAYYAEFIKH